MDDNNVQNSLCITSMKQELSGPTEAHGPFITKNLLFKEKNRKFDLNLKKSDLNLKNQILYIYFSNHDF